MFSPLSRPSFCRRCLRALPRPAVPSRALSSTKSSPSNPQETKEGSKPQEETTDSSKQGPPSELDGTPSGDNDPQSALTRRFEALTEDALASPSAQRTIEEAGFSSELKEKLLDKIADAKFRSKYSAAIATAELDVPASAGSGTFHHAVAQPWSGSEDTTDAVLRMLNDAKKPLSRDLRGKFKAPDVAPKAVVDMRIRKSVDRRTAGQRAAAAREKASLYSGGVGMKKDSSNTAMEGLSDAEKEEMRAEFRSRFEPAARGMPVSPSGMAALANERIERAIRSGSFANLPRGTPDVRDPRADNPFIDTTEYFMNKIIQKQEIVPPWIEKQQELSKAVGVFRARLRKEWLRHVSRMVAAGSGDLEEKVRRAEGLARAEERWNPRRRERTDGSVSISAGATDDVVMRKMREQVQEDMEVKAAVEKVIEEAVGEDIEAEAEIGRPFRDPDWEQAEKSYLELSIKQLNDTTRSYNLMAPDLAKKPYYSLQREMAACFADVAPLVAGEIRERATRPRSKGLAGPAIEKRPSVLEALTGGKDNVSIHLEADEKAYGLKEWWKDVWKR